MRIGERQIGPGQPCFVIAEAGVNHNGQLSLARQLIAAARQAGADAVKFQTFSTPELVLHSSPKAAYQLDTTDSQQSQFDMLTALELSFEAHQQLLGWAREEGIMLLSTPFDGRSVDWLVGLGLPALKLGSGELTDLPLLRYVGSQGKPVIASTGMSWLAEVEAAVHCLPVDQLALMHCVSNYPARAQDSNLRAMDTLRQAFLVPVGLSDHTPGMAVALAAVARGAHLLEKHLTLSHELPGPDHKASLEPADFKALVAGLREVEAALGDGVKRPMDSELPIRQVARKSLVTLGPVPAGQSLTADLLGVRRPGTGIPPGELPRLVGRKTARDLTAHTLLAWEDLQ